MANRHRILVAVLVVVGCGHRRHAAVQRDDAASLPPLDAPPLPPLDAPTLPSVEAAPAGALPAAEAAFVIDCVGDWHAGPQVLKFWGSHPDYAPDDAEAYRTDRRETIELRYQVTGGRFRLWRGEAALADVAYWVTLDESDRYSASYELRLGAPVLGYDRYQGIVATSFHCVPPERPAR